MASLGAGTDSSAGLPAGSRTTRFSGRCDGNSGRARTCSCHDSQRDVSNGKRAVNASNEPEPTAHHGKAGFLVSRGPYSALLCRLCACPPDCVFDHSFPRHRHSQELGLQPGLQAVKFTSLIQPKFPIDAPEVASWSTKETKKVGRNQTAKLKNIAEHTEKISKKSHLRTGTRTRDYRVKADHLHHTETSMQLAALM